MEKTKLLPLVVTLGLTGCAATYEDAQHSYQNGELIEAREIWQSLANEGDAKSMYQLYHSNNQPQGSDIEWLKKAADLNFVEAEYDYGIWAMNNGKYQEAYDYLLKAEKQNNKNAKQYLSENTELIKLLINTDKGYAGDLIKVGLYYWDKKDYKNALTWFNQCNENSRCQFYLGLANENGYGLKRNYETAYKWYLLSTKQNNKYSMRNLAWLYEDGLGTAMDKEQAFYWMQKASENNTAHANTSLGRYYLYGIGTKKDYLLAFALLSNEALTSKSAAYHLGKMYYLGRGVKQNYQLSYKWFLSSAKKGEPAAMWYLGQHYYFAKGRAKNYYDAINWYLKSAQKGDSDAQFRLGWMYSHAQGTQKNFAKAIDWYTKAAESGNIAAQNNLGVMHARGEGVIQNDAKAFYWYEMAANQGDDVAQNNLAIRYEYGRGVSQNYHLAAFWYAKSAQKNFKNAEAGLKRVLKKLRTQLVNASEVAIYAKSDFSSDVIKNLEQGTRVYVLSKGNAWTEIYHPEDKTLGFINNAQLL